MFVTLLGSMRGKPNTGLWGNKKVLKGFSFFSDKIFVLILVNLYRRFAPLGAPLIIIFPLAVNLLMATHKPKCRPLNSAYTACNAFCFGRDVYMIMFGPLAVYGFMMAQSPPKLLARF